MNTLSAPLEYTSNMAPGTWTSGSVSYDPNELPDRFTLVPGHHNYRGAQIAHRTQMELLKDLGVKHIISIAADAYGNQYDAEIGCGGNSNPCEPYWAEELGLTWEEYPMGTQPPSEEEWTLIKRRLAQGNTFFHCTHGVDRTGAIAARWRKEIEPNLTNEEVLEDYTYLFGGAWLGSSDSNRYLRAWVEEGVYSPLLHARVLFSLVKVPLFWGSLSMGVGIMGYRYYKER